ncbi:MAG: sensor histidine kinase [Gemmatimonadota bacterium]
MFESETPSAEPAGRSRSPAAEDRALPSRGEAPASRLTGLRLFGIALALATAIGLFSTVLLKVALTGSGQAPTWAEAATGWIDWYIWAALTPLVVWLALRFPITADDWARTVSLHVLLALVVSAVELALFGLVVSGYNELFMGRDLPSLADRYLTLIGRWLPIQMLIYSLIVTVVTAVQHGRRARERDVTAANLETELARTQVHALQAQIQPHFLFNTLNTISMAVRQGRNDVAVRMMAHLSGVLRRSMEAAVRPETTLGRELRFIEDYLQIEKCRLEERLETRWNVDEVLLDARVPTMLLQPLVENAVRHGIAEKPEGGEVTIHAQKVNGTVDVRVEDTGAGLDPDAEAHIGLENVRRRLDARYGTGASFDLASRPGGGTVARLILPLEYDERGE